MMSYLDQVELPALASDRSVDFDELMHPPAGDTTLYGDRAEQANGSVVVTSSGVKMEDDRIAERSQRKKTMTEKGLAYNMDIKLKRYWQSKKQLESKTAYIKSKMIEDLSLTEKEQLHSHWMTLYENFIAAYEDYNLLLDIQYRKEDKEVVFDAANNDFRSFLKQQQDWIRDSHNRHVKSSISRARSGTSHMSRKSSKSGRSSLSLASEKLREQQRMAELQVKLRTVEEKEILQERRMKLEQQAHRLELEEEMGICQAKSKIIDAYEKESQSGKSIPLESTIREVVDSVTNLINTCEKDSQCDKPIQAKVVKSVTQSIPVTVPPKSYIASNDRYHLPSHAAATKNMIVSHLNPNASVYQHDEPLRTVVHATVHPKPYTTADDHHQPYIPYVLPSPLSAGNASRVPFGTVPTTAPSAPPVLNQRPQTSAYGAQLPYQIPHLPEYMPSCVSTAVYDQPMSHTRFAPARVEESSILSVVKHLSKPTSILNKFSGDPLEYQRFMRQFKARVVVNATDDEERLNFLEQFTTGDAHKVVSGLSYLDSSVAYQTALSELAERYGDPEVVVNAYIKKALGWPIIKANSAKALDDFSIFLVECLTATQSMEAIRVLEHSENMSRLVSKLPFHLHDKWRNTVWNIKDRKQVVSFHHLVNFVKCEAKKAMDPTYGKEALATDMKSQFDKKPHQKAIRGSFAANVKDEATTVASEAKRYLVKPQKSIDKPQIYVDKAQKSVDTSQVKERKSAMKAPCMFCDSGQHALHQCEKLTAMAHEERIEFLKKNGLCYGCLRYGHYKSNCRNKSSCDVCHKYHPTILHIIQQSKPADYIQHENTSVKSVESAKVGCHTGAGDSACKMAVVPVKIRAKNGMKTIETYAFLDPGSNTSFCTSDIAETLGVRGKKMSIMLDTMGVTSQLKTSKIFGLEVSSIFGNEYIQLPPVYTKDKMPITSRHIVTDADIEKWAHLEDISLPQIEGKVGLLIGNNSPDAYTPLEIRTGERGSPHAARTLLGWIIWSVTGTDLSTDITVNRAEVTALQEIEDQDRLSIIYEKSVNMEFPEQSINDKKEPSVEDHLFLEKISSSIKKTGEHFEICLPFKDSTIIPDNSDLVKKRLYSLKRKLMADSHYCKDYIQFMNSLIENEYAERVPETEMDRRDGHVWYLPHHGIYHPKKKDKIRVVFDCAAIYHGVSLNRMLLQGPDFMNSLLGVLLRFRQKYIGVMGDIQSMFHQVKVAKEDKDCLRFYWWPEGNLDKKPEVFRMTSHIFGAVSSPSCCIYALQRTATDNLQEFPRATDIMKCFYVDDCLLSEDDEETAADVVQEAISICSKGGFKLTKWVSNSRSVLSEIPPDDRAKELQSLSLSLDKLPAGRALGVFWDFESDMFSFQIRLADLKPTRRNVLSIVSSVFDPLGLVSPVVLKAKLVLRDLTDEPWDSVLQSPHLQRWNKWIADLAKLETLRVPRCLKPQKDCQLLVTQLHCFSDASDKGYGIVVYIRFLYDDGESHSQLLLSRARVTPLKRITIPRMELSAATTSVKMSKKLQDELSIQIDQIFYWTDSLTVLKYIANKRTRYQTFVANRLSVIREGSEITQWRFIGTKNNPADCVSRGMTVDELLQAEWWLAGPAILSTSEVDFPIDDIPPDIPNNDPEVKISAQCNQVEADDDHTLDVLISKCSTWNRLKRVTGWILHYMDCLKENALHRKQGKCIPSRKLTSDTSDMWLHQDMLQDAEVLLCKHMQQKYLADDINIVESGHDNFKRNSSVRALNPVMKDGLLRLGGRQGDVHTPIIIPKSSSLARLLILSAHRKVGHMGRNAILSILRQRYWVIGAGSLIRQIMSKCTLCRRYRAQAIEQKMGDLPSDRITPNVPPFSRVGVDYFGPLTVKRGRSSIKRYGVIFSCLTTRAVHLEVAYSLDITSCINTVRRFIARRGPVNIIRSDNGTNLVGTCREIKDEISKWNEATFNNALQQQNITWLFNTPTASHQGGIWERLIRSVRKILYAILHEGHVRLDDESLQTYLCEVESILNNRPITTVSPDANDLEVLTPNHLLLGRSGSVLPPGIFSESDNYARRRWRHIQHLTNIFWKRWVREYLPTLQERQKWYYRRRNLQENDIVLMMDNTPRNSWTLGRVIAVNKDSKGIVRTVSLKTPSTVLQRPVHKLSLVYSPEDFGIDEQ